MHFRRNARSIYCTVNRTIRSTVSELSGSGNVFSVGIDSCGAPPLAGILQVNGTPVVDFSLYRKMIELDGIGS
jgi:hypothetical protein